MLQIYFDGACEPVNPGGTASYGWLVKQNGKIIAQEKKVVGEGAGMTNNVAEYHGLIAALRYISNRKLQGPLQIYGDSNLVCSVVAKKWGWNKKKTLWHPHKNTPHLRELLDQVVELLKPYEYSINWLPREQNQEADTLSKEASL